MSPSPAPTNRPVRPPPPTLSPNAPPTPAPTSASTNNKPLATRPRPSLLFDISPLKSISRPISEVPSGQVRAQFPYLVDGCLHFVKISGLRGLSTPVQLVGEWLVFGARRLDVGLRSTGHVCAQPPHEAEHADTEDEPR